MKKSLLLSSLFSLLTSLVFAVPSVYVYVDAAPNVYGSSAYAPWQSNAFAQAAAGTFVNMSSGVNSANVGTTNFEIQDEVVYSFGDLGKRLSWVYWIPNETTSTLNDRFQISLFNDWGGDVSDFYHDYYGSTWLTPTKWVDYDTNNDGTIDGVMGLAGMAWWGAYNVNTQDALDADIASWGSVDEQWIFTARLDGVETTITSVREASVVPAPAAIFLASLGLGMLPWLKSRKYI